MAAPYALRMRFSDESLTRRLEQVANAFMLEWLTGTGARLEPFGAAVAAVDPSRPELDFVNRVYGLWPEDVEHVPQIAALYRRHDVRGWLELAPCEPHEVQLNEGRRSTKCHAAGRRAPDAFAA